MCAFVCVIYVIDGGGPIRALASIVLRTHNATSTSVSFDVSTNLCSCQRTHYYYTYSHHNPLPLLHFSYSLSFIPPSYFDSLLLLSLSPLSLTSSVLRVPLFLASFCKLQIYIYRNNKNT